MKIEVILPAVNYGLAMSLLDMIDHNTCPPSRVILIDNTERTHVWMMPENFDLVFRHSTTKRLNESWEIGRAELSPGTDLVTFLNDDIIIGDWFFQRVIETFKANEFFGIACPNIVKDPSKVKLGKVNYTVGRRHKLEACAFTIKKEILDTIPPVPWKRITTFHGDSWVWDHTKRKAYSWGKDEGNNIFHYIGQSILKFGFRALKKPEFNEYEKIKKETWG